MLAPQPSQWIGPMLASADIAGAPESLIASISGAPYRLRGTDDMAFMGAASTYPSLTRVPAQPVGTGTGVTPDGPVDWASGALGRMLFSSDSATALVQSSLYNIAFLSLAIVLVAIGAFFLVRD